MEPRFEPNARAEAYRAFWEAWERLFGPPALEAARGRLVVRSPGQPPLRLPDVGQQVVVACDDELFGRRGLVLEVLRTAAAIEADGESPSYGWRLHVLPEGGAVVTCKPQALRCP